MIKINKQFFFNVIKAYCLFLIIPLTGHSSEIQNLNGIWFMCEYSISNDPPDDNCEMLDNDGFLVEQGKISHLKIKNSKQEGCRGDRTGHCFKDNTKGLKAKKRKIGNFIIGSNWVEVKHLTCTQRFWFKEYENFWHGWPDDKKCFWTRNKEFYVQRYQGELKIN